MNIYSSPVQLKIGSWNVKKNIAVIVHEIFSKVGGGDKKKQKQA